MDAMEKMYSFWIIFIYCLRDTLGLNFHVYQTEWMTENSDTEATYIFIALFLEASEWNQLP